MDIGLAAASQSGVAYRAIDADLLLAELFRMEVGEILGSGNRVRSHGGGARNLREGCATCIAI